MNCSLTGGYSTGVGKDTTGVICEDFCVLDYSKSEGDSVPVDVKHLVEIILVKDALWHKTASDSAHVLALGCWQQLQYSCIGLD